MQLHITDQAADYLREQGRSAMVHLIPPLG